MDVVTNARSVRGWVIRAKNLRPRTFFQGQKHHGDQVVRTVVAQVITPGTRNVEVAQGHPIQPITCP